MTIATFCSLVPGWFVVLLSQFGIFRDEFRLMMFQTTVRFVSIFAAVLLTKWLRPDLGLAEFYGWLMLFYLLALVTEVFFADRQLKTAKASRQKSPVQSSNSIEES